MVFEALRGYVQGATGLTEMTTSKARAIVRDLLASGETGLSQMSGQVDKMAKELVATGKANRDQLNEMIKSEVGRLLDRLDLPRSEEIDRLGSRIAQLEAVLSEAGEAIMSTAASPRTATSRAAAGVAETMSAIKAIIDGNGPVAKQAEPAKTGGMGSNVPRGAETGTAGTESVVRVATDDAGGSLVTSPAKELIDDLLGAGATLSTMEGAGEKSGTATAAKTARRKTATAKGTEQPAATGSAAPRSRASTRKATTKAASAPETVVTTEEAAPGGRSTAASGRRAPARKAASSAETTPAGETAPSKRASARKAASVPETAATIEETAPRRRPSARKTASSAEATSAGETAPSGRASARKAASADKETVSRGRGTRTAAAVKGAVETASVAVPGQGDAGGSAGGDSTAAEGHAGSTGSPGVRGSAGGAKSAKSARVSKGAKGAADTDAMDAMISAGAAGAMVTMDAESLAGGETAAGAGSAGSEADAKPAGGRAEKKGGKLGMAAEATAKVSAADPDETVGTTGGAGSDTAVGATGGAGSDTVEGSTGGTARTPRARGTTKTTKAAKAPKASSNATKTPKAAKAAKRTSGGSA
ncbi:phasin family protein [Planobispora takensis]|uniref:Polyhydroxyalkanoate synthesis regulator phasin n=1 Tax=Planobispora takensis TaxID=1367882 RepID=A0A8J3SSG6_9ACTN|nr:phasin family protein [Planobispora takensis]GIH99803.1 hypothetical protein Pta02_18120 [Planobispora takensis]